MEWNTVPTAKIAYDALRQQSLDFDVDTPDFTGPLMPWELLKEKLPREPVVFVLYANGLIGDEAPFMRLLAEMVEQLPGRYIILCPSADRSSAPPPANVSALKKMEGKVTEMSDAKKWAEMFRETPPDVVLTSQLFFVPKEATPQTDPRIRYAEMLFSLRQELTFPVYVIDSTPLNGGCMMHLKNWRDKIEAGTATIQQYISWQANPSVDQTELQVNRLKYGCKYGMGVLAINCYPAEIMTKEEMTRATGILCGRIEPSISPRALPRTVRSMIEKSRNEGKKLVLLARGGRYARGAITMDLEDGAKLLHRFSEKITKTVKPSQSAAFVNDGELAKCLLKNAAVLAIGAVWSGLNEVQPGLISLPYLEFDYTAVLPYVDLVIHHGGAGTTIAALKAGVPQLVVPYDRDCPDQIYHGARVMALGCGTMLAPHARFAKNNKELQTVVQAAKDSLRAISTLKKACLKWKAKLQDSGRTEGVPVAVDVVRRLIASVVMAKEGSGNAQTFAAQHAGAASSLQIPAAFAGMGTLEQDFVRRLRM